MTTRSESIGELAKALSKAQGAMEHAKKSADNPFFKSKYADLASVLDVARKPLADNGLCVVQGTFIEDSALRLRTDLLHSSGEWIASIYPVKPVKDDPQALGSAITYARRYAFQAMVGIAPEDDDGNEASGKGAPAAQKQAAPAPKRTEQVFAPTSGDPGFQGYTTPRENPNAHIINSPTMREATQQAAGANEPTPKQLAMYHVKLKQWGFTPDFARPVCQAIAGNAEYSKRNVSRAIEVLGQSQLPDSLAELLADAQVMTGDA
jgi:hypothetical protein